MVKWNNFRIFIKINYMALKKILKGLEVSLKTEQKKCPSTMLGDIFHKFKIKRIQNRIKDIEKELSNRKTKR